MRLVVDGAGEVAWAFDPHRVARLGLTGPWTVDASATPVRALAALAGGALWLGDTSARWPDGTIRALELPTPVRALACDGDAARLLVAGDDAVWRLAAVDGWRPRRLGPGAAALALGGDGHTTYVGRGTTVLALDDHQQEVARLELAAPVRALALSPAGLLAVIADPGATTSTVLGLGLRHSTSSTLATVPGTITALAHDRRRRRIWIERGAALSTLAPAEGAAPTEVVDADALRTTST